ncbi:MAG: GFA family protein [Cyanobacteria bacterium P01_A01_bin.123]
MSTQQLEGGCLCGRTRYRVSGASLSTIICHCVSCRRAAGAESVAWMTFPMSAFEHLAATPKGFNSSEGITRTFCPECGTSLTYQDSVGTTIDVALATLDDPGLIVPTKEIWLSDRIAWHAVNPDLKTCLQGSDTCGSDDSG